MFSKVSGSAVVVGIGADVVVVTAGMGVVKGGDWVTSENRCKDYRHIAMDVFIRGVCQLK